MIAEKLENETEWLAKKVGRLGATDARALMGCGYAGEDAATVYDRIVHGIKRSFDPASLALMREGSLLEGAILDTFAAKNPEWRVEKTQGFELTTNPTYPLLCCTLDAKAFHRETGEMVVVEAKNEAHGRSEDYQDDMVPVKHMLQVTHQLIVTGAKGGFLVSLLRGKFIQRWIERDDALIEQMLIVYDGFMADCKAGRRPDGCPRIEYARVASKANKEEAKYLGREASERFREAIRLQEQVKAAESKLAKVRRELMGSAKGCAFVVLDSQEVVKISKSGLELKSSLPRGVKVVQ